MTSSSAAAEAQRVDTSVELRGTGELARRPRRSQARTPLLHESNHDHSLSSRCFTCKEGRIRAVRLVKICATCQNSVTGYL